MPPVPTVIPDGEQIRARRISLGLTPGQLARKMRRHHQTIRQLENGRLPKASEALISQLARALGAKAEEITKRSDEAA